MINSALKDVEDSFEEKTKKLKITAQCLHTNDNIQDKFLDEILKANAGSTIHINKCVEKII